MKLLKTLPIMALVCLSGFLLRADDLGYDIYDGKTNKIDHIAQDNPRYVWVVYEGGTSGRKIPRTDLPPQLKEKYPYDAKSAAEYDKLKNDEWKSQIALQKQGLRESMADYQRQIDAVKDQITENEKEIDNLTRQIKTAPKSHAAGIAKQKKVQLIQDQNALRQRRDNLQASLKQAQSQLDALP